MLKYPFWCRISTSDFSVVDQHRGLGCRLIERVSELRYAVCGKACKSHMEKLKNSPVWELNSDGDAGRLGKSDVNICISAWGSWESAPGRETKKPESLSRPWRQ